MSDTLRELIVRLNRLTGVARRLDCDIWRHFKELNIEDEFWETIVQSNCEGRGDIPRYTESIDAAMKLLPPLTDMHRPLSISFRISEREKWGCILDNWQWGTVSSGQVMRSPNPAIALCIAILEVHAAIAKAVPGCLGGRKTHV